MLTKATAPLVEEHLAGEEGIEPRCAVSVLIPAYDEAGAVLEVLDQVEAIMEETGWAYEIVVIDDGSTDGTNALLQQRGGITLVTHPVNKGYGAALKSGIRKARGEVIVITDADGTYPNDMIPVLLSEMEGRYDMVVGARTGKEVRVPPIRKPAKWVLLKLANYLSGYPIPDLNSGLRAFKRDVSMKYFGIISDGFSFTTTITLSMLSNNYAVKYVPINYYRRTGKSKIKPFQDTLNFMLLIVRVITYFNPLKVFLPTSFATFMVGLVYGIYQLVHSSFEGIGQVPVLFILAGLQIGLMGLVADMISRKAAE